MPKVTITSILRAVATAVTVSIAISCNVNNLPHQLGEAESFMRHSPKQAKEILAQAGKYRNGNRRERASWCLLNVWAKQRLKSRLS